MHYLSLDHLIVYAFLLITLIVGILAGRGIKNMREYVIGNKMYGTTALVLTYLATNLAGATVINTSGGVFDSGIIMPIAFFGLIINYLVQAFFIAPRVVHFRHS